MQWIIALVLILCMGVVRPAPVSGQDFKQWQAQIAEYKQWLDSMGPRGKRLWIRLDENRRPHQLFLGERFFRADPDSQKRLVEIFSIYLAGHPDKSMLIDLFDATTRKPVGEYGWGGFKLNGNSK